MTTPEHISAYIARRRKRCLERCLKFREAERNGGFTTIDGYYYDAAFCRKLLRNDQKILLKLRTVRVTGWYPTEH
jgi:hypothetical protein